MIVELLHRLPISRYLLRLPCILHVDSIDSDADRRSRLRDLHPFYTSGPSHYPESRGDFLLVAVSTAGVRNGCLLIIPHVTHHVTPAKPVPTGSLYGWMGGGWGDPASYRSADSYLLATILFSYLLIVDILLLFTL